MNVNQEIRFPEFCNSRCDIKLKDNNFFINVVKKMIKPVSIIVKASMPAAKEIAMGLLMY
jgi:hypothetical protein